jgi:hypothetical protein
MDEWTNGDKMIAKGKFWTKLREWETQVNNRKELSKGEYEKLFVGALVHGSEVRIGLLVF